MSHSHRYLLISLIIAFLIIPLFIHLCFWQSKNIPSPQQIAMDEETLASLNSIADAIDEWFQDIMAFLMSPVRQVEAKLSASGVSWEKEQLFELLEEVSRNFKYRDRRGSLSLFDETGKAIAWSSDSSLITAETPKGRKFLFSVRKIGDETLLCVARKIENPSFTIISEFPVSSKFHSYTVSDLLPARLTTRANVHIELQERKYEAEEITHLFARLGKKFLSREEKGVVYLALRHGDGDILGVAKISRVTISHLLGKLSPVEITALLSYFVFCLFFVFLAVYLATIRRISREERDFGSLRSLWLFFFLSSLSIWSFRFILLKGELLRNFFTDIHSGPIYFGASQFLGLFQSPLDLLMTSLVILIQVSLLLLFCRTSRVIPVRHTSFFIMSIMAIFLASVLISFCFSLPGLVVRNSRINILLFEYKNHGSIRFILQASIFLFLYATALTTLETLRTLASLFKPGMIFLSRIIYFRYFVLVTFLLSLIFFFALDRNYSRLKDDTILKEFRFEIVQQETKNHELLTESLKKINSSSSILPDLFVTKERDDTIAYRLWSDTELSTLGTSSSLEIYNRDSQLISRFTKDLPGFNEKISRDEKDPLEVDIFGEEFSIGSARGKVLHGERAIAAGGMIAGVAVMHILNQPENIPFLSFGKSFSEFYGSREPALLYAELLGTEPPFIVYNRDGRVLFSSVTSPPPLPAEIKIGSKKVPWEWAAFKTEGFPYQFFILNYGDKFFVTGYPTKTFFNTLGLIVKSFLLSLVIGCLILISGKLIINPAAFSLLLLKDSVNAIRQSYYRKLLAAIIIASLLPLLLLAFIIRGYIQTKAQEDIIDTGLNALAASRRVVQDYLSMELDEAGLTEPAAISDEVLLWLSKIVHQDINLYSEGTLIATNRRDLFLSGLLPRRLGSEAYRSIILEEEPFYVKKESTGSGAFYTLYSALDISGFKEGVISIPLNISQSAILKEAKNVEDAILIITAFILLLLSGIGYFLASSISRPIVGLVRATTRLASGDYEIRMKPTTSDETGLLVKSFNEMAESLRNQREDLKKRKNYIEKILNNITAGVISTDDKGNIVTVNPAASSLLTQERPLQEGDSLLDVFSSAKSFKGLKDLMEQALYSSVDRVESEVELSPSSKPTQFRVIILPFLGEGSAEAGKILLLEDITEVIKSNRLSAWAEMAKNIAHEIKNPLTPIQLTAEHLNRIYKDKNSGMEQVFEECIKTIIKQVRELRRISEDFSSYAKLPELKKEMTDAVTLLKEVLAPYRSSLPERIVLGEHYEDVPSISMDRRVMKGALTNIIENSIQAIPGKGEILVSVSRSSDYSSILIVVEDTGEGIPKENLDRLFDPYFSTKEHGTGIGLAIAKKVVEEHGGKIQVESELHRGTKMAIMLPLPNAKIA
ncbi:MAG: ATP-binding protein [Acidobacteriota bacterium]